MSDIILHHYALSPFSEKIRVMLGYTGLPWQSVIVREMPPRPELEVLTGGYRKIPVMQIGADIFCDTRAISSEIARISGKPELAWENNPDEVQQFVTEVDLNIFLACIIAFSGPGMLVRLVKETSLMNTFRFLRDRIDMGRRSRVKALPPKAAKEKVMLHIGRMEQMLEHDFLFGDTPCIADFSAYHSLWYVCDLANKPVLAKAPRVQEWMHRMRAFSRVQPQEISAGDALNTALQTEPRTVSAPADANATGKNVRITPDDYGRVPVTGELIAEDDDGWIVARDDRAVGRVHVHLPKQGFSLKHL
ncbi:glutathione S-transferase family protein [Marinobacter sp. 1Y8]